MTSLTLTSEPIIIVPTNPDRTILLISNLSDTSVYVFPTGGLNEFTNKAHTLKLNGLFEVQGMGCYKGPIYAMNSAASDIRIFEA